MSISSWPVSEHPWHKLSPWEMTWDYILSIHLHISGCWHLAPDSLGRADLVLSVSSKLQKHLNMCMSRASGWKWAGPVLRGAHWKRKTKTCHLAVTSLRVQASTSAFHLELNNFLRGVKVGSKKSFVLINLKGERTWIKFTLQQVVLFFIFSHSICVCFEGQPVSHQLLMGSWGSFRFSASNIPDQLCN